MGEVVEAPHRIGLVTKVLSALGVLQAYNIVARSQDVVTLSQTVKIAAAWWHYFVGYPFRWIGLKFDPVTTDLLVLVALAFAALARSHKEHFNENLLAAIWHDNVTHSRADIEVLYDAVEKSEKRPVFAWLISGILLVTIVVTVSNVIQYTTHATRFYAGLWMTLYLIAAMLVTHLLTAGRLKGRVVTFVATLYAFPLLFLQTISIIALSSERELVRFCGWLVALLALSASFHYVLDPFVVPRLGMLPMPPAGR